jgi:hypothetical protein
MLEEIQQAESAIRVGDTKSGFEILREVLTKDPDSERAWWIMSGLVQRDQRAICLEQVLRINPDNLFARQALDELLSSPPKPETKPRREIPPALPVEKPITREEKDEEEDKLQSWLHARGSRYFLTILGPDHLTRALTEASLFSKVRAELKKGKIPDKLLLEMQTIPITSISSVKQLNTGLHVFYQDGLSDRSMRLSLADQSQTEKVLGNIMARLGTDFALKTQPIKTSLTLGISLILSLGGASLTAYIFWLTQEIMSGRAIAQGTVRSQFIINQIQKLGSSGAVMLGAFVLLISLSISALLILKPPTTTTLTRRE